MPSSDHPPDPEPGPLRRAPRARRRAPRARGRGRRLAIGAGLALLGAVALGSVTLAALFWSYGSDPRLPQLRTIRDYRPQVVTHVRAADGRLIGELYGERRTVVPYARIPRTMIDAIVAAEDSDFFRHQGLDYVGMLRALVANLRAGHTVQGASTITQQVVKTFFQRPERSLRYKVQQVILARRLERLLTKDEILYLYLNQIYFGHGRYGIEEAARFYFGKGVEALDVGECALLAALPKGPEQISPLRNPERAKARQRYVLEQMVRHGKLDAATADRVGRAPIRVVRASAPDVGIGPEWVDQVRRLLVQRFGEQELPYLGIEVETTMDVAAQRAARRALEHGLVELDGRQGFRGPTERLRGAAAIAKRRKALAAARRRSVPGPGEAVQALVTAVDDAARALAIELGGDARGLVALAPDDGRYDPAHRPASKRFAAGDVVWVRAAPERSAGADGAPAYALDLGPQGAVVVLDPATREVRAMVGGYGFAPGAFNRALRARRQPGSTFKPFVYAAALASGRFTPASLMNDAPEVYALWKPQNYEKEEFLGSVRLRVALARSINTVAIKLLSEVGVAAAQEVARACGIGAPLVGDLSLALGASEVTPLELVNAFGTFAAEGRVAEPRFVRRLGTEVVAAAPPTQALRPEVAFLVTSMLRSVVEEGTARAALRLQRPIAGKTGTSNGQRDAWFVGFTPQLVAGVWVGFDDTRKLGHGEAGARAALPIWIELAAELLRGQAAAPFAQPPGVVVQRIDPATGLLAAPGAPDGIDELFLEGTVPTEAARAAGQVDPNAFDLEQAGSP